MRRLDSIDKAAQSLGDNWNAILHASVERYAKLRRLPTAQVLAIFETVDFPDIVKQQYGGGKQAQLMGVEYASSLLAATPVANIPDEVLQALINDSFAVYDARLTLEATKIKNLMIRSVVGRQSEAEFAASLLGAENAEYKRLIEAGQVVKADIMTQSQANALANDTLRKFSRTVSAEMAESAPEGQLWIWDGPIDDLTSQECLDLIAMGPSPKEAFGAAFTNGTHFGCRHDPQPYVGRARQNKEADARAQEKRNEG